MFELARLQRSFRYAFRGLSYIWKTEQNFRIQIVIACGVILASVLFQIELREAIILGMLIIMVLVLEMINTIFEKMVDILKPRMHTYVKVIKDMMAAVVFIASLGSSIIALIIFVPYFVDFFSNLIYNI